MTEPNSPPEASVPNLERVLANMELRALRVLYPDERARIFNLAGDLCFDAGTRERSLAYYGRAIDVHLDAEQHDAAVAVCCKIVRLTPEVVRARCTLAWLLMTLTVPEALPRPKMLELGPRLISTASTLNVSIGMRLSLAKLPTPPSRRHADPPQRSPVAIFPEQRQAIRSLRGQSLPEGLDSRNERVALDLASHRLLNTRTCLFCQGATVSYGS